MLELLREEKTIAAERHVHPTMLHRWRKIALAELPEVFARGDRGSAERAEHEKKIHEVYAQIGRLSTELEWMKKTPMLVEVTRQSGLIISCRGTGLPLHARAT